MKTGAGPLKFFEAHWSAGYLTLGILLVYAVTPLTIDALVEQDHYWRLLAWMAFLAAACIGVGFSISLLDFQFSDAAKRFRISGNLFHGTLWLTFIVFAVVVVATADNVPLYSAFNGATAQELSDQRGEFLKIRSGWEASLSYLNAFYTSALLPYSIAALFLFNYRMKWFALAIFLVYCELSLEKALYLKALLPLVYLALTRRIWDYPKALLLLAAVAGLMYVNTELSSGSSAPVPATAIHDDTLPSKDATVAPYFSSQYRPTGSLDFIVWRILGVPIFTAADSLKVFESDFQNQPLWGATSTMLSGALGLERVPFEALVHGRQFGGHEASHIGRSNSVFFTEAFINFGWLGVVTFGLFIGQSLRWFRKTRDFAFSAVWPIYVMNVFQSGLIGNLLSNGFIVFFAIGLFVKIDHGDSDTRPAANN